ncbi:MAG: hypothetical protein LBR30_00415 [Clostridioides sp.]|nr:hypothetical protein [Clostridioides sp.]
MKKIFKCNQNDEETIPLELLEGTDIKFPTLHQNATDIAYIAVALKEMKKDSFCKVPFCTTVEAEALGAKINLGNEADGPRASEYSYNSIDEILEAKKINLYIENDSNILESEKINYIESVNKHTENETDNVDFERKININLDKGRIREVLNAISILKNQGQKTVLNITGPFTIISMLIDLKFFYKALRKQKEKAEKLVDFIIENVILFAKEGAKVGADVISYSDPLASIEIVGPKVYNEIVATKTFELIKKLDENLEGKIIHICGRVSSDLENSGYIETEELNIENHYEDNRSESYNKDNQHDENCLCKINESDLKYGEKIALLIEKINLESEEVKEEGIKKEEIKEEVIKKEVKEGEQVEEEKNNLGNKKNLILGNNCLKRTPYKSKAYKIIYGK